MKIMEYENKNMMTKKNDNNYNDDNYNDVNNYNDDNKTYYEFCVTD